MCPERESAESGAKYRGLLEAAPDAMVVVNQSGEIVLLNLQAEKQFGYRRDELVGQQVTNIIPEGFAERLIADDRAPPRSAGPADRHRHRAHRTAQGRQRVSDRDHAQPARERRRHPGHRRDPRHQRAQGCGSASRADGGQLPRAARGGARRDGGGQPGRRDRPAQPAGREAVRLPPRRAGRASRSRNIIPEGFAERLIADDLRSAEDALAQQIGTGIELTGRRKDGSDFPIEIMLSPLESAEGILVTAAIRDISVRKEAEAHLLQKVEELNRSNEELEQFAYVASHDLQEPLRMVASYTQLLARRYKGKLDADADEFIAFAVDGASRMQRLIQDLLAYSRVGTRGADLRRHLERSGAASRRSRTCSGAIEESGAVVTHDPLPVVLADETQLIQLFQNLVGNAIKYQSPGVPGSTSRRRRNGSRKWTFSVNDNGLGIDPQYFERIFGMFQRLHKRDEFAGTGIGLAICKKIVERHGGTISVESAARAGLHVPLRPDGQGARS